VILVVALCMAMQSDALTWSELPPLPSALGLGGPLVGTLDDGAVLWVGGGANFPDGPPQLGGAKQWHQQSYVLSESEWKTGPNLPQPLAYAATVPWQDGLIIVGGCDSQSATSTVLRLDEHQGEYKFTELPSLPQASAFLCATIAADQLWVLPGSSDSGGVEGLTPDFYSLNLLDDNADWKFHSSVPFTPRVKAAMASRVLGNGEQALYVFGGENPDGGILQDSWRFLPASSAWQRVADMPRPLAAAAFINVGPTHTLVFSGDDGSLRGKPGHPGWNPQVYAYHTHTDTWVSCSEMKVPVVTTSAVAWQDGYAIPSGETRPTVRTAGVAYFEVNHKVSALAGWDWAVIFIYLGLLVGKGFWFSRRNKSSEDFFVAGKRVPWWAAGLSIYGTSLSSITFLATPALAYATDLKYMPTYLSILIVVPLVTRVFLPFYRGLNLCTAYEYLELRFSPVVRKIGSGSFVFLQLARMGIVVYLPSLALSTVTGVDIHFCILATGILSTAYTVVGGLEAVIWTDVTQVVVLFGGVLVALFVALSNSGGLSAFSDAVAAEKLLTWDGGFSFTEAASWSLMLGAIILMIPTYTADQTVVQRYLAVKDIDAAKKSAWLNGWMAIPSGLLFPFLGACLWAFYRAHPQNLQLGMADDGIFPLFIGDYLPTGVAGLVIAGLLAATMSSLDSSMHSVATACTNDFYRPSRSDVDDARVLVIAKRITIIAGLFGTCAALFLASFDIRSLFLLFLKVLGLLSSGVATLFLLGAFVPRANTIAALVGAVGCSLLLAWVSWYTNLHAYWFGAIGLGSGVILGWVVSRFSSNDRAPSNLTAFNK
jgi:solute:Na+ symporter, SSS family